MLSNAPKPIIKTPNIWMPKKGIDMSRYAVIACDQFTSQPEYWKTLETYIGTNPSTFKMVLPEVYLDDVNDQVISTINQNMQNYLEQAWIESIGTSMILVDRTTQYMAQRLGLIMSIDLEAYSYEIGSKPLIRTTEKTIIERIPPRMHVRKHAPLELTHVMLLMDDPEQRIIERLYERRSDFKEVYNFKLNMDGGHIAGYQITDTEPIVFEFMKLIENDEDPLLFVVGDGNHSLATAKAHWENLKKELEPNELIDHPARYALVEVVNLYDHGLDFEGIHRILFNVEPDFISKLQSAITPEYETNVYDEHEHQRSIFIPKNAAIAYEQIQAFMDAYLMQHPETSIDYIHGEGEVIEICKKNPNSIGIIMPKIEKKELFPYIKMGKVLPRKSFSMGHATDKRYYLEAQMIIKK
jgi:uncharacterized protein (DUF1015 family)